MPEQFCCAVTQLVKQGDAVGLGPEAHLSSIGKGGILDLEQRLAVEGNAEARSVEVDTQAMPGVGRNPDISSVTASAADDVERASNAVDGLVENDIILKRIGPDHVVIVRVFRPPDNAGGAILRSRDGLELHLDEAVPDVGVVLQDQGIGGSAGLLEHLRF